MSTVGPIPDAKRNGPADVLRQAILLLWALLACCVVVGSLLPASSPVMADIGLLPVSDKVLHFCAYFALSSLPVIGFRARRRGILVGVSMMALGALLEAGQRFSPGRAVELGDLIANSAGIGSGVLLALPVRAWIALP